ncbi:hypothetical protein DID96_10855 [Burkholderia sp. Bp8963]|uniref:hypothetical protein n=1 Tax=Burkholderia sp. Bp8963 TaxID=2184547 RepID=UPI000F5B56C1|nr:hypothetical protein [Burkholderia sp. Bp8963]RQS72250.1 hypothetical protein DID96_10855 [Burkholderia sp. Bp8963]
MTSTFMRRMIRLTLWLIATPIVLVLLLLVIVVGARYEKDEGSCPDAPAAELEARILVFAKERGYRLTNVRFENNPRYHADALGWWGFNLSAREGTYGATIDCKGRITGFGKIQQLPLTQPSRPNDSARRQEK